MTEPHAQPGAAPIRLLIVDDHPSVRQGLIGLFAAYGQNIMGVGEAHSALEALIQAESSRPDVVLTDLQMKPTSGIELIAQLRQRLPSVRYVVFTASEEVDDMLQSYDAGAQGFVNKEAQASEIIRAIESVMAGSTQYPSALKPALDARVRQPVLTLREREVLQLVGQGLTSKEIARKLDIDYRTVDTHRANIKQRLGLDSSAALLRFAMGFGAPK